MGRRHKDTLTLVGIDIEGEWNIPLLRNATEVCGAQLAFAASKPAVTTPLVDGESHVPFEHIAGQFDRVIACETTRGSRNVFDFPDPRGRSAVIVGNESAGIPEAILRSANHVICVPVRGSGMTSMNVAVAAAVVLYALTRDLGRRRLRSSRLTRCGYTDSQPG